MTIEEFLAWAGSRPLVPVGVFVAIPIFSWVVGFLHQRTKSTQSPWKFVYSALVFLACIPGVFAAVVVTYTFFFSRGNLLKLDVAVTFVPIVSMIATLVVISRRVDLERLPAFDRLWGLIGLLTVSFVIALILDRLRVWLFFGGGMFSLLIVAAILFFVFRATSHAVFSRRR